MSRFTITSLLLLVFLHLPCAASSATSTASEVPFTLEKGYIIVPAKVKGNRPVEVVLATGAEHSIINDSLLEKYNLSAFYTGEGIVTGTGLDRTYSYTPISDVQVGDAKLTNMNLRLGSEAPFSISKTVGREIFAILGVDFFKGRAVQFDFNRKVIRFLSEEQAGLLKERKLSTGAERALLRMTLVKERVTMPVVDNVSFSGKKIKTLLDTGSRTVTALTPSTAKQLGFTVPPAKGDPRTEKVGSIRLGDIELTDVPVMIVAKGSDFDLQADGYAAVAGLGLLQNFIVTFDFRSEVVILEHV
jgi:hypothetical protein